MVGGDRNLFVRKGALAKKRLGNTDVTQRQYPSEEKCASTTRYRLWRNKGAVRLRLPRDYTRNSA